MSDNAETEPSERLYPIQNSTYYYYTGHLSNGHQVMMLGGDGPSEEPELAGLPRAEFDSGGNLVAAYTENHLPPPSEPIYFNPGTIHVKFFFIEEMWFGADDLPMHYQLFLEDPETADEEKKLNFPGEIVAWRERGNFVVWCNEEYFLDKEGRVTSS